MTKEQRFFNALRDVFVGARVEGQSGFINLMRIKSRYYEEGVFPRLKEDIDRALEPFPEFREELFDRLYAFFRRYFTESGSIGFHHTPFHERVYEQVYTDDRDVALFWKTHMLYYVKTDRLFHSMDVEVDGFRFHFDVSTLEHRQANEKRALVYTFRERRDDGTLVFTVALSAKGRTTSMDAIRRAIRDAMGLSRYTPAVPSEETLERAIRLFERQSQVDYFINKDARAFLQEQLDLWLYQYVFEPEERRGTLWTEGRVRQLQVLRDIASKIIHFIAQFEDELVRIWNKPGSCWKATTSSHWTGFPPRREARACWSSC
jgi:adenine-specific DNA-methyltransferase